jgi:uncharacterized damage-inducible protein DinB
MTTVDERVQRIETSVQRLIETVEALPTNILYREPAAGEWPVMSTLAHVVEVMPYWAHQAVEVAGRQQNDLPFGRTHDDPDRIAAVDQHGGDSLDSMLPRLRQSLDECVRTLRSIPADRWTRTAHHANRGEMSIEAIVDSFLVNHVQEHLAQAQQAITALR